MFEEPACLPHNTLQVTVTSTRERERGVVINLSLAHMKRQRVSPSPSYIRYMDTAESRLEKRGRVREVKATGAAERLSGHCTSEG